MITLKYLKQKVDEWKQILNIDPIWEINCSFDVDGYLADNQQAEIMILSDYYIANILFKKSEVTKNNIDHIIAHEYCHLILNGLYMQAEKHFGKKHEDLLITISENTVERLARGYLTLYKRIK